MEVFLELFDFCGGMSRFFGTSSDRLERAPHTHVVMVIWGSYLLDFSLMELLGNLL